ncbi:hypothetical protein D3C75_992330 [compost metagenome]
MIDVNRRHYTLLITRRTKYNRYRRGLECLNMFFCNSSAHEKKPVHLLLKQGVNDANLLLFLFVCITQNNVIVVHVRDIFNTPCNFREN